MGGVDEGESGESSHDGVRAFARHAAAARGGNMSALSEEFKALLQAMVRNVRILRSVCLFLPCLLFY